MRKRNVFCLLYILCATALCAFTCCVSVIANVHRIHLLDIHLLHRLPRIFAISFLLAVYEWVLFRSTERPMASILLLTGILMPIAWQVSRTACISQIIISVYSCMLRHRAEREDEGGWMAEKEWYAMAEIGPMLNGFAIAWQWYVVYPEYFTLIACPLGIVLCRVILRVYLSKLSVNWNRREVKILLCSEEMLSKRIGFSSYYHAVLNYLEFISVFPRLYAFYEDHLYSDTLPIHRMYNNGIRLPSSYLRYMQIPDWKLLTIIYHHKGLESIPLDLYRILHGYKRLGSNIIVMKEYKETEPSERDLQMTNDDGFFIVQYGEEHYETARASAIDILFSDIRPVLDGMNALLKDVPDEERYAPIRMQLKEIVRSKNQLEAFDRIIRIVEYMAMYMAYFRLCYDNTLEKQDISRMSFGTFAKIAWADNSEEYGVSGESGESDECVIDSVSTICKSVNIEYNARVHLRYKEMFVLFVNLRNRCIHGSLTYYASDQLLSAVAIVAVCLIHYFVGKDYLIADHAVFTRSAFEESIPCFAFDSDGNRYIFSRIIRDADGEASNDLNNVEYYSYEHGIIHGNKACFRRLC